MVARPEEHAWSSYQAFVGQSTSPKWLRRDFILGYFANKEKVAQQRYRAFIEDMLEKTYESPLDGAVGSILGDEEIVGEVTALHLKEKEVDLDVPALRKLIARPSPEQIISKVITVIKDNTKSARQTSIYLCHRYSWFETALDRAAFRHSGVSNIRSETTVQ